MPLLPQYEVDQCGRESIVFFFLMFKFCFEYFYLFVSVLFCLLCGMQIEGLLDLMSVQ